MTMSGTRVDALTPAACLFSSLGDSSRLVVVQRLLAGEQRVCDLVAHLGLAQSTVSRHVACLRECGLLESRQVGRSTYYRLTHPAEIRGVLEAAERLLDLTGESVRLCSMSGVGAS